MSLKAANILIICGEASADYYGASLATKIQEGTSYNVFSIGGQKLAAVSTQLMAIDTTSHSVAFDNWMQRQKTCRALKQGLPNFIQNNAISTVIIIDFPNYNFYIANLLKKEAVRIVTFITPNFWIWNNTRSAKRLLKYSDIIITIFEKEYNFYAQFDQSKVYHFGHPLTLTDHVSDSKKHLDDSKTLTVGLFPGSRVSEIRHHLPAMCRIITNIQSKQSISIVIYCSEPEVHSMIQSILDKFSLRNVTIQPYKQHLPTVALTAPGTTTLLLMRDKVPMTIIGQLPKLSYWIAKYVLRLKVPFIGLPNIISGHYVCPEYIQNETSVELIAADMCDLMQNNERRDQMVLDFKLIWKQLQANPDYYESIIKVIC